MIRDGVPYLFANLVFTHAEADRDPADEGVLQHLVLDQGDVIGEIFGEVEAVSKCS